MLEVKPIDMKIRKDVINTITENWGSTVIVSKGKIHSVESLPGFVAGEYDQLKGIITYTIQDDECEIVSLDSLVEKQGIGTLLINRVIEEAKMHKCSRVWLITTNDNTPAIRFYQKRGFSFAGIYINAIQESRRLKPQIPLTGIDDIPILHEIEFEKVL